MPQLKRTYAFPQETIEAFEHTVAPEQRDRVLARLLQNWLAKRQREEQRQAIIAGCQEMAEIYLEVEQEYHPLEEEVARGYGRPIPNAVKSCACNSIRLSGRKRAGERPALVISPDLINQHSPVVLLAALTIKKTERVYPFEALIEPPEGGLTLRSKVLLMQLRAVDKRRLVGRYGVVSEETMRRVEAALKVATGLT